MAFEFVCRRCGRRLFDQDEGDARLVCCLACGWELSIPCGEPLTLEVSEPEDRPSPGPEPATASVPDAPLNEMTPAARLIAIGTLAGLGAWLRARRRSGAG